MEEEGVLKLEYKNEALDERDFGSNDGAARSIKSRSPFKWKNPRSKDIFDWFDKSDKFANFKNCSLVYAKKGTTTIGSVLTKNA